MDLSFMEIVGNQQIYTNINNVSVNDCSIFNDSRFAHLPRTVYLVNLRSFVLARRRREIFDVFITFIYFYWTCYFFFRSVWKYFQKSKKHCQETSVYSFFFAVELSSKNKDLFRKIRIYFGRWRRSRNFGNLKVLEGNCLQNIDFHKGNCARRCKNAKKSPAARYKL